MKRHFKSLYSGPQGLYAIAKDGTAWRWSDTRRVWDQVVPLPDEPDPQPQENYDDAIGGTLAQQVRHFRKEGYDWP